MNPLALVFQFPPATWVRAALYCAFTSSLMFGPAHAVVGTIDSGDRFPFVVQLKAIANDGAGWGCTGAVSMTGLVSTAAHCVWDPEHGRAKRINIIYKDADGVSRTVSDYKIFYPKEFEQLYSKWFNSKNVVTPNERKLNFHLMSVQDIAFIVPADNIEVEGFPHWATELLESPSCGYTVDDLDSRTPPERCWGKFSASKMAAELGEYVGLRAIAVGYGNYFCSDYSKRDEPHACKTDDQRRFAEVRLISGVSAVGRTFKAPELWCSGTNDSGINPVQHGDSGGPRFIRAKDGRWLFVGYTSGGSTDEECASSIFMHLDLWREAATYKSRMRYKNGFGGANNWTAHQLRRFLDEYLESWSGPSDETTRRQKTFFDNYMGQYLSSDGYKAAIHFAEAWPNRTFRISPGSEPQIELGDDGDSKITAEIDWTGENPASGRTARGSVRLSAFVRTGWPTEAQFAYGMADNVPYFSTWECTVLSGGSDISGWGCDRPASALWSHNGSSVRLSASGTKREFYYVTPRKGLSNFGVTSGALLFSGKRSGNTYVGTAYVFDKRCGPIAYSVSGEVSSDDLSITMRGKAPKVNETCTTIRTRDDTLVFRYESSK